MSDFETSASFLEYRGERLRYRSGGDTFVRVETSQPLTLERFPEALEFSSDAADPWVMLPRSVFDAVYKRRVTGLWRNAPVAVDSIASRGLVEIRYIGDCPKEAVAAGFRGDQYDGWSALVPPSEIEDITVTETAYPMMKS